MKKLYLMLFFFITISILSLGLSIAAYKKNRTSEQAFRTQLFHLVQQCISNDSSISEKESLLNLLKEVEKNGYKIEYGSDDLRAKFVFSQGCIEHVLACSQALGEIVDLIGVIHTPMPATPLCTKPDPLDTTLLDHTIRFDLTKLLTVHSRTKIIREFLVNGGTLYVVYPQGGVEKRSAEQQRVYLEELLNYPDHLFDWPLDTVNLESDRIGATYFF